jgi:hypothetical protein
MDRKLAKTIMWANLVLILRLSAVWRMQAQDTKTPYPTMAPIDQHRMTNRNAEISLARRIDVFLVPVGRWSHGSAAPVV